jgi:hypothetical protein
MNEQITLIKRCQCPGDGISTTRKCSSACFVDDTRQAIDAASIAWTRRVAAAGNWRGGFAPYEVFGTGLGPDAVSTVSDWVDSPDQYPLYIFIAPGSRGLSCGDGREWEQKYRFEEDRIVILQRYPGVVEERHEVRIATRS